MGKHSEMTRRQRMELRNQKVKELFDNLSKKYPQWRTGAIIDEMVPILYYALSDRTIENILSGYYEKHYFKSNE